MKKIIALLLVVVIAATVLSVTAFAAHRDGFYNGKSWKANLDIYSRTQLVGTFSMDGISKYDLDTKITINYAYYNSGKSVTTSFWSNGYVVWGDRSNSSIYIKNASMLYIYKGLSGTLRAFS